MADCLDLPRRYREQAKQPASSEWREVPLGDVCTKIGSGATPRGGKEAYVQDGPYDLIRSQNIYNAGFRHDGLAFITDGQAEALRNIEVFPGDVLLNITGYSVARVCQTDPTVLPAHVNQHVAIVRTDPRTLDARYLRYYLAAPEIQSILLSWAGSGGTRNALTKQMIESFEVRAPPDLAEQRAIAHVLRTLDDTIELNRRMNETLEQMARALFKSWFVDFDPVRAKAALKQHAAQARESIEGDVDPSAQGRHAPLADEWTVDRARDYLAGMDPQIADLFPDRLVDSELGEIPEPSEVKLLGEAFRITMGQSPPGKTYNQVGDGLPFYQGRTDFGFRFPERRVYCTAPTPLPQNGDSLVSVRAPVGDRNMAREQCCIGRGVAAVRHRSGSKSYTYYSMRALSSRFKLFEDDGTVFGAVNKTCFHIDAVGVCRGPADREV